MYPILTSDFLLNGGDGYDMFDDHQDSRIITGEIRMGQNTYNENKSRMQKPSNKPSNKRK